MRSTSSRARGVVSQRKLSWALSAFALVAACTSASAVPPGGDGGVASEAGAPGGDDAGDDASQPQMPDGSAPSFSPVRIACGQTASVTDAQGNVWSADVDFAGGTGATSSGQAISGTDSAALYDGQRYGANASAFTYTIPVPDGSYDVLLKFTENYATGEGQRVFDVAIDGSTVLNDFDIYAAAGDEQWAAVDKTFPVTVGSSGKITIAFTPGSANNPKVDAIAIASSAGGGTQDAGPDAHTTDAGGGGGSDGGGNPQSGDMTGLHVSGGHLVNGAGAIVQLHGADHSYTEDTCTYGGFADGHLVQADLTVMKSFHLNAVRVPLNEDCWLGINGVATGGAVYQSDLASYLSLITSNGMAVILDLHWTAPGAQVANLGQLSMADSDHSPDFWSGVAAAFASQGSSDTSGNSMVVFDLFNEPFLTDWGCWLDGGCNVTNGSGATYPSSNGGTGTVAGMATLYAKVRAAGAQNVVMMGGLGYSSDLSQWVSEVSQIAGATNIAASLHEYSGESFGSENPPDWNCENDYQASCVYPSGAVTASDLVLPSVLSAGYPIVLGETGMDNSDTNTAGWFNDFLSWFDQQNQSYMAWSWNFDTSPVLLSGSSSWSYGSATTTQNGATYPAYLSFYGYTYVTHVSALP